ncbi:hypothetical protein JQ633_27175 [Bradyrhizobium tropiciagri]|nr:hypothetical protein [Bradyrhizobium tropiciagri]
MIAGAVVGGLASSAYGWGPGYGYGYGPGYGYYGGYAPAYYAPGYYGGGYAYDDDYVGPYRWGGGYTTTYYSGYRPAYRYRHAVRVRPAFSSYAYYRGGYPGWHRHHRHW